MSETKILCLDQTLWKYFPLSGLNTFVSHKSINIFQQNIDDMECGHTKWSTAKWICQTSMSKVGFSSRILTVLYFFIKLYPFILFGWGSQEAETISTNTSAHTVCPFSYINIRTSFKKRSHCLWLLVDKSTRWGECCLKLVLIFWGELGCQISRHRPDCPGFMNWSFARGYWVEVILVIAN